jgi:hypothetical protein
MQPHLSGNLRTAVMHGISHSCLYQAMSLQRITALKVNMTADELEWT